MPRQLLLAHRGYSGISPENTQLAFDLAYWFDFDGVELDVHLTKDQILVIIHDETTTRTAHTMREIEFSTLAELQVDDHSRYFRGGTRPQPLMTLEAFLDLYLDKFSLINVEIKTDQKAYPGIEAHLVALGTKYGSAFETKIVFSSFNFTTLQTMRALNPRCQLAFLWWKHREFCKLSAAEIRRVCNYLNPWSSLYDRFGTLYRALGLPLMLWTIKSARAYQKYAADPAVAVQISNYKFARVSAK